MPPAHEIPDRPTPFSPMRRVTGALAVVGGIIAIVLLSRRTSNKPEDRHASVPRAGSTKNGGPRALNGARLAPLCEGTFVQTRPVAVSLLDAGFDARPAHALASRRMIALTLSVPRSVKLYGAPTDVSIKAPSQTGHGLIARVEEVANLPCRKGTTRCTVAVRLSMASKDRDSALDARVVALRSAGARLSLSLTASYPAAKPKDSATATKNARSFFKTSLTLSLGCLTGAVAPARYCTQSRGALLILAKPLSQNSAKQDMAAAARTAAVALARGPHATTHRFDAVALPVVAPHSASAILQACGTGRRCRADRVAANRAFERRVRDAVAQALRRSGAADRMAHVRIVRVCAFAGTNSGCPAAAIGETLAARVAARYRWSGIVGADETVASGLSGLRRRGSSKRASHVFDAVMATAAAGGRNSAGVRVPRLHAAGWTRGAVRDALRGIGSKRVGVQGGGKCVSSERGSEFARCERLLRFEGDGRVVVKRKGGSPHKLVDGRRAALVWSEGAKKSSPQSCAATVVAER